MSSEAFVRRHFPSRIAQLGFSVELPQSWQPQDLPDESPDFEDGTRLFGLAAAAAPYAAMVFAAAARPAFADGTVLDWARWLIEQNAVDLRALGESRLGELPAVVGQCAAPSDFGEMLTHFAFAEDGERLIHLSVTGPAAMAGHVWQVWWQLQNSFSLETPRGATVALMPCAPEEMPPPDTDGDAMDADVDEPAAVSAARPIEATDDRPARSRPAARQDEPAGAPHRLPEWARRAYVLESQDRLQEAEQAMISGCDHLGVLISIAEMYRLRMLRLAEAGQPEAAAEARARAIDWARRYAAGATSGGEGAALSRERDEFIASLPAL